MLTKKSLIDIIGNINLISVYTDESMLIKGKLIFFLFLLIILSFFIFEIDSHLNDVALFLEKNENEENLKIIKDPKNQIEEVSNLFPEKLENENNFQPENESNSQLPEIIHYCNFDPESLEDFVERKICYLGPILIKEKGLEIDLATKKVLFIENGKIQKIRNLLYQSPENKWFQSPTGFFKIKTREKIHFSSISLVWMPYSMQYYEDFFLHGIPYKRNGTIIDTTVSGGCLRFKDEIAKEIYDFVEINDPVLVYFSLEEYQTKEGFHSPLDINQIYVFERFYNPLRITHYYNGDRENLNLDYYNHTGLDVKLKPDALDDNIYAIKEGKIVKLIKNGEDDKGMGNTVIIEHNINGEKIYSLYAHLSDFASTLFEGKEVKKGEIIGKVGATGFGCDYWRIGKNGCNSESPLNPHLHLEIKKEPVLNNPFGGKICKDKTGLDYCYRYAPDPLLSKGYYNPLYFIYERK